MTLPLPIHTKNPCRCVAGIESTAVQLDSCCRRPNDCQVADVSGPCLQLILIEANTVPGMTPSTVLFHQVSPGNGTNVFS